MNLNTMLSNSHFHKRILEMKPSCATEEQLLKPGQRLLTQFNHPIEMEVTQLQFAHLSILLHAKGLFLIDNNTFLKVRNQFCETHFKKH